MGLIFEDSIATTKSANIGPLENNPLYGTVCSNAEQRSGSPHNVLHSSSIMWEAKKKKIVKREDIGRPGKMYHVSDVKGRKEVLGRMKALECKPAACCQRDAQLI